MCAGVQDINNTVTLDTADPICLVSDAMFDEAHISGCNTYTSIQFNNSCMFFILALMAHYDNTVLCHMDHDAYSRHGGLEINC